MADKSLKHYLLTHFPLDRLLSPAEEDPTDYSFNKYKVSPALRVFTLVLRLLPWICGLGFITSFFIDFPPGFGFTVFGKEVSFTGFLKVVCVSGLIGFGTNYLAIRMLFRPVVKRPVWGQGLIPAQRDQIIYTLARGMHEHILNQDLIRQRLMESGLVKRVNDMAIDGSVALLSDAELRSTIKEMVYQGMHDYLSREPVLEDLAQIIDGRVNESMEGGMKKLILQAYKKYNPDDYRQAIHNVIGDIPKVSVEVMEKLEGELDRFVAYVRTQRKPLEELIMDAIMDLLNRIDIPGILRGQMAHFDEARLERMVWEATNEQLLYIQYLGTLLGMLGGLLIWQPELMAGVFLLLLSILFVTDTLLFRLKKRNLE